MTKTEDFFKVLNAYIRAHQVVMQFNLWPYLILPGLLSLIYITGLIITGSIYAPEISAYITSHWIPGFLQGSIMRMLATVMVWFLFPLLGYMTYKYVILILFSPILGHLSEIVEEKIYHQAPPAFSIKTLCRDLLRGLVITLRNMLLTIVFTFLLWLLVFIPVIGVFLSPFLIILMQAFYDGYGLFDFTLERKQYSVKQSIRFGRTHRSNIIGTGLGFILMLLIPVVGWFAAPAYGTIAATLSALETIQNEQQAAT